ncbi:hypothetical protein D777_01823 [Marinobacter nitratireducens]|uniref:Uncharacterized protein n=1 Tax=Marinobacter nitratireducens TaxID=1137280 RepID=A0A072N1C6_9GAMM|nr:hypothetical protein [Marinobacter nitratireducens]KEF31474.1 hypothetical protein D777_01823 [Marinobacter nitratireducens]
MTESQKPAIEPSILPGGLIAPDQWKLPETSVRRSMKGGVRHLLDQLRAGISVEEEPFRSLDDLPLLSPSRRQRLAPEPDYSTLSESILTDLDASKSESSDPRSVAFLVAPPFSGFREALVRVPIVSGTRDNDDCEWRVLAPPDSLLMDDARARQWWDKQDLSQPWVIPELADFWLRHTSGLALVRELLRRISAGEAGQGIVGCSSWCWQFWQSYCPDMYLSPRCPAPLDATSLGRWLEGLACQSGDMVLTARMTHDGQYVLPLDDGKDGQKQKHSAFLRDLAATSRGIHGVALAIWQRSLRARPEDDADQKEEASREGNGPHCWVAPLEQLSFPIMPQSQGRSLGFVLHALLLHDGLDENSLTLVTGLWEHEVVHILARLSRADIVVRSESAPTWHVTALGYLTVRRHLQSWGFPVDGF